jgi:hypothetical protein
MDTKQLLDDIADLESRIAVIYERFVARFKDVPDVSLLWQSMSREEVHHADLLSLAAGAGAGLSVDPVAVNHVGRLQAVVTECEAAQREPVRLQDALRATADLEEAEAEHLPAALKTLGDAARSLVGNAAMEHQSRRLLEHAIRRFGTPALQQRLAWHRFHD